jgi:hypothetical protein
MPSSGIETATFRIIAQCLNYLRYRVLSTDNKSSISDMKLFPLSDVNWIMSQTAEFTP